MGKCGIIFIENERKDLVIDMNLGINKYEAEFLKEAIAYYLKSSQCPDLLVETYNMIGVDIKAILTQLQIIEKIGEEPLKGDIP